MTRRYIAALCSPGDIADVNTRYLAERLQRAIGTTYDPEDELKKHYSYASLPPQFDEYIWFDETRAVKPLSRETLRGVPDTFPFGL